MPYRLPDLRESRFAILAERLAFIAPGFVLAAILATRSGQAPPELGLLVLTAGVVVASAALAVGFVAAIEIWRYGHIGLARLFRTILVAAVLLAYPSVLAFRAARLPPLNDISTDIVDPPVFSTNPAVQAAREGRRPPEIDRRLRISQERAYPQIRTLVIEGEAEETFQLVLRAAKLLKWRIIEEVRPDDNRGLGRIEAIDETFFMRFRDDITIRLRSNGGETRIDVRSASRFGRHDLGANAARIRKLFDAISNPPE